MKDYKYRICKVCGKQWNVSELAKNSKLYICPLCVKSKGGVSNGKIPQGAY